MNLATRIAQEFNTIRSLFGANNGLATLDSGGKVPSTQLPSYVDDVIEVPTYADLPATGEDSKIYIVVTDETQENTTSTYRWTGTVYALVSQNLTAADVLALLNSATGNVTVDGVQSDTLTNKAGDGAPDAQYGIKSDGKMISPYGFKNKIINGWLSKAINQRGAASIIATSGAYNYDHWYYDCTYLYTWVENTYDGDNALSWISDATAHYQLFATSSTSTTVSGTSTGWTAVSNGGTFNLASTSGKYLWIRFTVGTDGFAALDEVLLEDGTLATQFPYLEHLEFGLKRCQRYLPKFEFSKGGVVTVLNSNGNTTAIDKRYTADIMLPVETRVPPTGYVLSSISHFNIGEGVTINETAVSSSFLNATTTFATLYINGSTTTVGKEGRPSRLAPNSTSASIYFTGCER